MIEHALVNTCFPKSKFQDLIAQDIQFLGRSSESSIQRLELLKGSQTLYFKMNSTFYLPF